MFDGVQPVLEVTDLACVFRTRGGPVHAVNSVSFDLHPGELLGVVGESGSGKSVTMKAIMGLLPHPAAKVTAGRILFDGRDLLTMPERDRLKLRGTAMSMVFQDPMSSLNPVWTIQDQLGTILKYADRRLGRDRDRAGRRARVIEVLGQVRMRDPERVADSFPVQLSGGMRQRVLIAMALLSEPRLLIADEPGTALDVTTQAQILKLLRDLVTERHLALLMITHNLGVVRETSAYTYVMHRGEIVEEGATQAIFAAPQQQYTRDLIAAVPRLTGKGAA